MSIAKLEEECGNRCNAEYNPCEARIMIDKFNKTRGGSRPNAGAPKKDNPAKSRTIRLTDDDWLKLKELGGVEWLRLYLNGKI